MTRPPEALTMFAVTYDAAQHDAGKSQPGARQLMLWCLDAYPSATNLGIYAPRNVRGGGALSVHAEGRAIDVGFPDVGAAGNPLGWQLAHQLVAAHVAIGIQCVIYARRIWSTARPAWRAYGGTDPHTGHVHAELNREAAQWLTAAEITAALGGGNAMPELFTLPADRRTNLAEIQQVLSDAGFYAGKIDADPGPATLAAVHAIKNHLHAVEAELDNERTAPLADYAELRREVIGVLDRYAA